MSHDGSGIPVRGHFIGGREIKPECGGASADLIDVMNPTTGEPIARIAHAREHDVDSAFRSAEAAFTSAAWGALSPRTRARLVNKLADVFEDHLE